MEQLEKARFDNVGAKITIDKKNGNWILSCFYDTVTSSEASTKFDEQITACKRRIYLSIYLAYIPIRREQPKQGI